MDCIRIRNLEVFANHGVLKEENTLGQKFIICADMYLDLRPSGKSDDIAKSVHYGDVCRLICDFMSQNTYYLIEAVAEELAKRLLLTFDRIIGVELEIKKPWAPIGLHLEEVSVKISRKWHDVYLSLGSNVGDLSENINEAVKRLNADDDIRVIKVSGLIKTKPYGNTEQGDFLNGAAHIRTIYAPSELLKCINEIESLGGRNRKKEVRWGPRTIDIDILLYDDLIMDTEELIIPHVDMINRDFVLKPLSEIARYLRHPVYNMTISQLLDRLSADK